MHSVMSAHPEQIRALCIGDMRFSLRGPSDEMDWACFGQSYLPFQCSGKPDFVLEVSDGRFDATVLPSEVFRQVQRWSYHKREGRRWLVTYGTHRELHEVLVHDSELRRAVVYRQGTVVESVPPIEQNSLQMLLVELLSQSPGALMHGCGLSWAGSGFAFLGESGAGKSTMAKLWLDDGRGEILCDDRILVGQRKSGYYLFGTPWHGDIPVVSAGSKPLRRLYLLKHANANYTRELAHAEAVSRLMTCVFPAWWDRASMAATLAFLDNLVRCVPCRELGFTPTPDTVQFLLRNV